MEDPRRQIWERMHGCSCERVTGSSVVWPWPRKETDKTTEGQGSLSLECVSVTGPEAFDPLSRGDPAPGCWAQA